MYKKILVAYNATPNSKLAMHQAAELAKLCDAQLLILGIVVTSGGISIAQAASSVDLVATEHRRIAEAMKSADIELTARGIAVTTYQAEGEPSVVITRCAAKLRADLIVVGHSNKNLLARWFQSSTGAKLLDNLSCSLLIANPN